MEPDEERKFKKKLGIFLPDLVSAIEQEAADGIGWHYSIDILFYYRKSKPAAIRTSLISLFQDALEVKGWFLSLSDTSRKKDVPTEHRSFRLISRLSLLSHLISARCLPYYVDIQAKPFGRRNQRHILYQTVGKVFKEEECVICRDAPSEILFESCGHFLICNDCWSAQRSKLSLCPMCRTKVRIHHHPPSKMRYGRQACF